MTRPHKPAAQSTSSALPALESSGKLRLFFAYVRRCFRLDALLDGIRDNRRHPSIPTTWLARVLFLVGLLRVRSFNALDPRLGEATLQRSLGILLRRNMSRICSVDTLAYSLVKMVPETARAALVGVVRRAERNKVFREGWHGALRFVAIDGWEPICSRSRHCEACLTREVSLGKNREQKVTEYYHRFVVALLLDDKLEVVLDVEPVRNMDVRIEQGDANVSGHEGELTAAKRLVQRLRSTYGRWLDVLVLDALYSNGPFLTLAKTLKFGVISILKNKDHEPLKEAMSLWGRSAPEQTLIDTNKDERVQLWSCSGLQTLMSYDGPIRVVRAEVDKQKTGTHHTWCLAATGAATRLSNKKVLDVGRARWHIENTGFYQWTHYWSFAHVFTHSPNALYSLFWIFFLAFNLLQLFLYRHLGGYTRDQGKDVTKTTLRLIDEMSDDLARLQTPLLWNSS